LEQEKLANTIEFLEEEINLIKELNLLTLKPMLCVLNIDEKNLSNNFEKEYEIKICAKLEAELADLSSEEAMEYTKELKIKNTGLDQLIEASYKLLNLITFFTSGQQETRAWTINKGTKAPVAAGEIHTDFQKGFIKAEVIDWKDFVETGGETKSKEKGLMRIEGKDYIVRDGDVVHFKVSV